ncbi:hypothetical protein RJ639_000047 [Escallonia herrerae]|uniref:ATP-dependent helicase ATRX n=1 Tax=Escallonia herrerae TaxID=1293975 RepID=A0AA88XB07_9ASTE|nr:hypothetical protein RJ639_000047 [Escallonia herrerae]
MDENNEASEELESVSSDSFIDDSDENELLTSGQEDGLLLEARNEPLTEREIEELIAELLEVESKAAEAQEALEDESLAKVEVEVREELAQSLSGDDLEKAVAAEMAALKEEWEAVLDDHETESAHLLEQLDGAGIELPSLYKWIESEAPNVCCTEAWKKRTHWVGSQVTSDLTESVAVAEKYLQNHRPVRRRHGKVSEVGASGFLGKRFAIDECSTAVIENSHVDWCSFEKMISSSAGSLSFGSEHWASVYKASTPQQAAELGLKFPGVDEVEEISDIEGSSGDPDPNLSEEQKRNYRKVKEEDDVVVYRKLQRDLKQRRLRIKQDAVQKEVTTVNRLMESNLNALIPVDPVSDKNETASQTLKTDVCEDYESPNEPRGSKRPHDCDVGYTIKKSRVVTIDSDNEGLAAEDSSIPLHNRNAIADKYIQKNRDDAVPGTLCASPSANLDLNCTACGKVSTELNQHPLLEVVICGGCKLSVEAKMQVKGSDCYECYCGWCGRTNDLVSCRSCRTLFCSMCIKRNFGEEFLLEVQASGWKCCCCTPSILKRLTSQLQEAIVESKGLLGSDLDSDSDDSDGDVHSIISTKRRRKKKIRRILDDAELGEETKRKIAIEKERQARLKSLGAQFSSKSMMMNSTSSAENLIQSDTVEVLSDALRGYIVNAVREEGEEAVRIPSSISTKLKPHQIKGIQFMWENIIQSIRKVRSGDKGLGCILAHTMGLGKTLQVITFLYAAMRRVDLGLKCALIVTPVNVLHNWRHEFEKWKPTELKPLRVSMLEDVSRERRVELLMKWRSKGGVLLIGYTAFRNLSVGKYVKDRDIAREMCNCLQDGPDILVCDEAHMIKNTRADITQALKQVKCQRRIALTGSPLQNNLMEYYCMVDFVREGFLGSSQEFRNRFQNPIANGQHTNSTSDDVKIMNQRSHILYEQLKGFVQRMDMNVVKKDLPPKTVFVIAVKLSPLQRKLYKKFLDVHGFTNDTVSNEKIRKSFFAGYQALAQIWNHPGILELMKENRDYGKREEAVENFLADDSSSEDNIDENMINGDKLRNKNELLQRKNSNKFFHEVGQTSFSV